MNFDLERRLGSGYFGEVWLATDIGLNAVRAVKLIPPDKVPDPKNFFREAQLLKAAEHPNIVRVESTGIMPDGRVFVAMEYLSKGSLEDEAKGAYVHLSRAKRIMIDVLRGLGHAHGEGIVHRDIKPANILVGSSAEGKLSDFGLAVSPGNDPSSVGANNYDYILHIAPEIHAGRDSSVSTDIYAAGVTLYRLVNGDSYLPVLPLSDVPKAASSGLFPDRTRYRAFVPLTFRKLINQAMAVDPRQRHGSAEEMRRALERLQVHMNWSEKIFSDKTTWIAGWDDRCYQVDLLSRADGRFDVVTQKGKSKESLRRIRRLCREGVPKPTAQRLSSRILQDFVSGRAR